MNKSILCFLILGFLAVATFAHHHPHVHHMNKDGKPMRFVHPEFHRLHDKMQFDKMTPTTLYPNVTYLKTIQRSIKSLKVGSAFSVSYKKGDSIAVQIVHTSDTFLGKESPVLTRCSFSREACVSESKFKNLSFEVSAAELEKTSMKKFNSQYIFALFAMTKEEVGANVGIYVCVGKNASLANCKAPCTRNCGLHGTRSDVMNVCVCEKGYNGIGCDFKAGSAPNIWSDSFFDEFNGVLDAVACVISVVMSIIFFVVVFLIICTCCACLHACCMECRRKRGRVINNNRRAVPPPPAYAYHPLGVPPPPPPPPMQQGQYYDINNGNAIEMSTMPVARNANPVYIMPPLAPVKQVPVFIQPPPAPKN